MSVKQKKPKPGLQSFRPKLLQERHSSSPARDDFTRKQKVANINKAINANPVDIASLKQLAISREGLVSDDIRKKAYVKLLDININDITPKPSDEILHGHRDYQQVILDVNRSLKRFPPGMKEEIRMSYQDQLVEVIMRVLVANPELHYYQGYHDICVTFLLVAGDDITFAVMDKLSNNHLRDFMDANMDRTKHMLNYLYPILGKASPELKDFMEKAEVGTIFCLSWLITWYGHVLSDFKSIVRFYDFFMACHQLMPIYLAAAIVLYRKQEILSTECEMCYVHSLLSKIPPDLPFENLIVKAGDLFVQYPPKEMAAEAELQSISLKNEMMNSNSHQSQKGKSKKDGYKGPSHKDNAKQTSLLVKMTVWTLVAVLSAAVFAAVTNPSEWKWFS